MFPFLKIWNVTVGSPDLARNVLGQIFSPPRELFVWKG